jgi:hypothetical protein
MSVMDIKALRGPSHVRGIASNVPPDFTPELPPFPQLTYPTHPGVAWPISITPAQTGKLLDAAIPLYSFRPHNLV